MNFLAKAHQQTIKFYVSVSAGIFNTLKGAWSTLISWWEIYVALPLALLSVPFFTALYLHISGKTLKDVHTDPSQWVLDLLPMILVVIVAICCTSIFGNQTLGWIPTADQKADWKLGAIDRTLKVIIFYIILHFLTSHW